MIDSQNRPLTFEELERLKYNWVFAIFFFFLIFREMGFSIHIGINLKGTRNWAK